MNFAHAPMLMLADVASAAESQITWPMVVAVAGALLSLISNGLIACVLYWARNVDDRLRRGEERFDALIASDSDIRVKHAMDRGEVAKVMEREFVRRDHFDVQMSNLSRSNEKMAKELVRLTTLVEAQSGKGGASRG